NEPSVVCVPMSMPRICCVATSQHAPATPTVAAADAALVLVMAFHGEVGAATVRNLVEQLVVERREQEAIGRGARVGVVDDAVLELEDVPAGHLGHAVREIGADVLGPVLEPVVRL